MELNTERLKTYMASLVVIKKGEDASSYTQLKGAIQPIDYSKPALEMQELTSDLKDFKAFTTIRVARQETKVEGYRIAVENRKKKE